MKLGQRSNAVMRAPLPMRIKGVLWVLARRANDRTGECWTSMKRLADDAGCSVSVAQRAVIALEDLHVITAIRNPRRVTHFIVDLRAVRLNALPSQIERLNPPLNLAVNPKRRTLPCSKCRNLLRSTLPASQAICRPCRQLAAIDSQAVSADVLQLFPESQRSERKP